MRKIAAAAMILGAVLLLLSGRAWAGETPTNLVVLDSLARVAAGQVCAALPADGAAVSLREHRAAWLVRARLAERCPKAQRQGDSSGSVGVTAFGVRYERLPDADDSLRRICTVALAGTYPAADGTVAALPDIFAAHEDVIAERDIAALEADGYDFARGILPPPPGSFIRDVIEPLTVVGAAALTVLLLFTVRSQ